MKSNNEMSQEVDVEAERGASRKDKIMTWMRRPWFAFAFASCLALTFLSALGCISPPLRRFYMYNIDASTLIESISDLTEQSRLDLDHPYLPDRWVWGLSGICAVYESPKKVSCRYAFPPTPSIEDLIVSALSDASAADALSSWRAALASLQSKQSSDTGKYSDVDFGFKSYRHLARAGAAFVVLAMVMAFADLILTLLHPLLKRKYQYRPYPKTSLWTAAVNSLVLGTAVVLLFLSVAAGPAVFNLSNPSASDLGKDLGPTLPLLTLAAILLIGSVPVIGLVVFIIIPIVAAVVAAILTCFGLKFVNHAMTRPSGGGYRPRSGITSLWTTGTDSGRDGDWGWSQYESQQYESTPYEATPTQPESNS